MNSDTDTDDPIDGIDLNYLEGWTYSDSSRKNPKLEKQDSGENTFLNLF